jgi:peptide/nickel transport system permease protein
MALAAERRRTRRTAAMAVALLAGLGAATAAAPWLAPYDPREQLDTPVSRNRPPGTVLHAIALADGRWQLAAQVERTPYGLAFERLGRREEVAAADVLNLTTQGVADRRVFLLGSDGLGRDVLSRLLHGGRVSLVLALLAVILALTVGVLVGALTALGPRWLDGLLMRTVDAMLAIPLLFLLLALSAFFRPDLPMLIVVLGATSWMGMSRLLRAELRSLVSRDFVLAARGIGASPLAVLARHLLPNAWGPLLVQVTLLTADVILVESALSFLGFGVQPPIPSWGSIASDGRSYLVDAWWTSTFAGSAIALTTIALNLLADSLRDLLDPKSPG